LTIFYHPLQKGDIFNATVRLRCPPCVAICEEAKVPFGMMDDYVKLYLEWLYFKSGKRGTVRGGVLPKGRSQ
jgi:hypothetical protein